MSSSSNNNNGSFRPLYASDSEGEQDKAGYSDDSSEDGAGFKYSEGAPALHIAVIYGHIDTVKSLIKNGSDINIRDKVSYILNTG